MRRPGRGSSRVHGPLTPVPPPSTPMSPARVLPASALAPASASPLQRTGNPRPERTHAEGDLAFELYRQHTLLVIMATCLRRTSESLTDPLGIDLKRIRRALDVHRDYLVQVHYPDEDLVNEALESKTDPRVFDALVECKAEHPRAQAFQQRVASLLRPTEISTTRTAEEVAQAFRSEADRIEMHLSREEEMIGSHLAEWVPLAQQNRLLTKIRKFDAPRIAAEVGILVWASELGPSAD